MKKYLYGFLKCFFKKNISLLSLVDMDSKISDKAVISRGCKLKNVDIDDYSYISKGVDINNCSIGKFCSIAPNVKIGFGAHPTNFVSTSPLFYTDNNVFKHSFCNNPNLGFEEFRHTKIGNDVWIGLNAIILDGVIIGNGAIIGAGAVVTKNVQEYSIVGGVPAKMIKNRFEDTLIDDLKEIKWWDYNKNDLKKLGDKFYSVGEFIEIVNNHKNQK